MGSGVQSLINAFLLRLYAMSSIAFEKITVISRLENPLKSFAVDEQMIEYRRDPLTGWLSVINARRAERVKQAAAASAEKRVLDEVIESSRKGCFFCPENIERSTPRFPQEVFPEGRLWRGECCIFPNLYPFAKHHAVATLTTQHFVDVGDFRHQNVFDNLWLAREFFRRVREIDPKAKYPMFNWNHLPPAAASIIHPHTQILVEEQPTPAEKQMLEKSKRFFKKWGECFWEALVREERRLGERMVYESKDVAVVASFAPRGNRELQLIVKYASSLLDLSDRVLDEVAKLLCALLRGYSQLGVGSFNTSTYSAGFGEGADYFWTSFRIISRPQPATLYTSDTGFMERFHDEWVIEGFPEDFAKAIRRSLDGVL